MRPASGVEKGLKGTAERGKSFSYGVRHPNRTIGTSHISPVNVPGKRARGKKKEGPSRTHDKHKGETRVGKQGELWKKSSPKQNHGVREGTKKKRKDGRGTE